tara:strand:+ start:1786 stop:2136 length:351 start_codon:yes stop_codon:yes gene_type:complete
MNKDNTKEKRAGFTQGPWEVTQEREFYGEGAQPFSIRGKVTEDAPCEVWICRLMDSWDDEFKANAHLIASAPELYEQCKLFERAIVELLMQGETGADYELEKLREVLAKADGGAEG